MKDPRFALFYSVIFPGLGQLYLGEGAKGWTLVFMTLGVWVSLVMNHGAVFLSFLGAIYLAVMVPAARDAYETASGRPRTFAGDSVPYVIAMLLLIGPFAIPLLWQSRRFSTRAKILWAILVIGVAFLAIAATSFVASLMDRLLHQMTGTV